jgi:hypothetical protein
MHLENFVLDRGSLMVSATSSEHPSHGQRRPLKALRTKVAAFLFCITIYTNVQAEFLDEGALPQMFLDINRPAIVFITGGGSATDEQRRGRGAFLKSATGGDVVIFKTSSWLYWSEQDMLPLQQFLADRTSRGTIGHNLQFLVSSAGVGAFEQWIYDPRFLPPAIGAVFIAQPFSPNVHGPPLLPQTIHPDLYVVYDIRMPSDIQSNLGAGPRMFQDSAYDGFRYITLGLPENAASTIPQVLCEHTIAVGWSEELATSVIGLMAMGNRSAAEGLLDQQMAFNGMAVTLQDRFGPCFYCLEILARTVDPQPGQRTVSSLGWGPSINNAGQVAFIERFSDGVEGVYVIDQTSELRSSLDSLRSFGDVVQINDAGQVVWRQETRDGLLSDVIAGGSSSDTSKWAARNQYYNPPFDQPSAFGRTLGDTSSPIAFFQGVTINNSSRILFSARLTQSPGNTYYAIPDNTDPFHQDFVNGYYVGFGLTGLQETWPLMADNRTSIVRWGTNLNSSLVLFSDETLRTGSIVAGSSFFRAIGQKPGISDDGSFIAFAADHYVNGVGIYGIANQHGFKVVGIAQPSFISDFSMTPRVGVNRTKELSPTTYTVAYLATRLSNQFGLYATDVDISNPAQAVTVRTRLVIKQGDHLSNLVGIYTDLPGELADIAIYDPINNRGQLVFWVRTSDVGAGSGQAIVRATRVGTFGSSQLSLFLDQTGLLELLLPDALDGYVLDYAASPSGPFYVVPIPVSDSNGALRANFPALGQAGFFRMHN